MTSQAKDQKHQGIVDERNARHINTKPKLRRLTRIPPPPKKKRCENVGATL